MVFRSGWLRWSGRTAAASLALVSAVLAFCAPPSIGQEASPAIATLSITGKVEHPLVMHDTDLAALPRRRLAVTDEKGKPALYEGVPVVELLRRAGAPLGKQLKGPRLKLYLLVTAADGYQVVFALSELDPDFTDRVIILANRRDGHKLGPHEGPFRFVVPGEKRHARWIRGVSTLTVEEAR